MEDIASTSPLFILPLGASSPSLLSQQGNYILMPPPLDPYARLRGLTTDLPACYRTLALPGQQLDLRSQRAFAPPCQ